MSGYLSTDLKELIEDFRIGDRSYWKKINAAVIAEINALELFCDECGEFSMLVPFFEVCNSCMWRFHERYDIIGDHNNCTLSGSDTDGSDSDSSLSDDEDD
jgi:hypothetical protein